MRKSFLVGFQLSDYLIPWKEIVFPNGCLFSHSFILISINLARSILYISFPFVPFADKSELFTNQESSLLYKTALAKDNNVHYLVNGPSFAGRFFEIEFVSRPESRLMFLWFAIRYVRKHSISTVIIHGTSYFFSAACMRVLAGVSVFLQHHGEKPYLSRKTFLMKWTRRFISGYFFHGMESARPFINAGLIPENKVCEVTEGTTDFNFTGLPATATRKIIAVGRLNKDKDMFTLLRALAILIKTTGDFSLDLYYSTSEQEPQLSAFAESHHLSNHVNFKGRVEHRLLEKAFNSADIFVSCSRYEGGGYALIEALACGVFPIVSAIPPHAYLLNGLKWQRLFEPGNETALARLLTEAISSGTDRQVRLAIRQHFESRASAVAIASQVNSALSELIIK